MNWNRDLKEPEKILSSATNIQQDADSYLIHLRRAMCPEKVLPVCDTLEKLTKDRKEDEL